MISHIKNYFLNLNLFTSDTDDDQKADDHQRRSDVIATRIYLVLMTLSLVIIALAFWLNQQTVMMKVQYPTKGQYEELLPDVQCLCSHISIFYGDFIALKATFHQVCTSDFVSSRWLHAIYYGLNSTYFNRKDFRTAGSAQFQTLASFCRFFQDYILRNIALFNSTQLISPYLLTENLLQSQVNSFVNSLKMTLQNNFLSLLDLMREMAMGNRLMSGLKTNLEVAYFIDEKLNISLYLISYEYQTADGSRCYCQSTLDCFTGSYIMDEFGLMSQFDVTRSGNISFSIPGFSSGCLPVTGMLFSTLDCFFNQSCLNKLISFLSTSETFKSMDIDPNSQFQTNSTIQSIVEHLMVEKWIVNASYDKYYDSCAPISCTYMRNTRHSFIFIIGKVIGLVAGITMVLGFVVPIPIRYFRSPKNPKNKSQISLYVLIGQTKPWIVKRVYELNIFKNQSKNERHLHHQRIATRFYIGCIVIFVLIIAVYLSVSQSMYRETINYPTESQYTQLQQKYSQSLSCPCSSISINYSTFVTIKPMYHQICSSDFITSRWLHYIDVHPDYYYPVLDYRVNAINQFELLTMLCHQAENAVVNALETFMETEFVGSQVITKIMLESEMNVLIESWKKATVNNFWRTIEIVEATRYGNHLMNGYFDVFFEVDPTSNTTTIKPMLYENCSCGLSQSCNIPMKIYYTDYDHGVFYELFNVPNFFIGCFPLQALLASTLECFYNESCMKQIDQYMTVPLNKSFNFLALNSNLSQPNETIESIVYRIMVDNWLLNISFTSYYDACAPLYCTFEYAGRNSPFNVLTTTMCLFGGLSIAFKLLSLITLAIFESIEDGLLRDRLLPSIKAWFLQSDAHKIKNRLHVIMVLVILCIFCIFSVFTPQSMLGTVKKPSLSTFKSLVERYSGTVQCPCSRVSIEHQSFLTLVPNVHHICSSDFISYDWINYLYNEENVSDGFNVNNTRPSLLGQFQLLNSLCKLSQDAVDDTLVQFNTNKFISGYLVSSNELEQNIKMLIKQFQETMPTEFLTILSLDRELTSANMIMSSLSTSWAFSTPSGIDSLQTTHTEAKVYDECDCGLSSKCVKPSRRMMVGCYPLEALLQSTLECFYDQQCIDSTNTFKAINSSLLESSRFNLNSTIELLLNNLMVDNYTSNISYENYFTQCAPSSCTYVYTEYSNVVETVSTVIGIYGGLVIICRSIATLLVVVFQRRLQKVVPAK